MIKVFGIGNILLGDDGIGVYVVDKIKDSKLALEENIEFIVGETDFLYCINEIHKEDVVIIIDSIYLAKKCGSISLFNFKECNKFLLKSQTSHEENLLDILIKEKPYINGYLIGIEIEKVKYSLNLSDNIFNNFEYICNNVLNIIENIYWGIINYEKSKNYAK